MRRLPLVLAGLGLMLLVLTVAAAVTIDRREPTALPRSVAVAAEPVGSRALRILHGWDRRRARAWSHGSVPQLRALYGRSVPSGAADCAMLSAYRDRGLRVVGMRRQTLAVRQQHATGGELSVRVTDRLVSALAVGDGTREPLPGGAFETQTLTFRRTSRGWIRVD